MQHSSFAILTFPSKLPKPPLLSLEGFSGQVFRGTHYLALCESSVNVVSTGDTTTLCEGYGTHEEKLLFGPSLAQALAGSGFSRYGQQAFSYAKLTPGSVLVGTDWLGQRQLYTSSHENKFHILSNDLSWHSRLMRLMKFYVEVDTSTLLLLAATGSPLSEKSSICGVKLLKGHTECRVDSTGALRVLDHPRLPHGLEEQSPEQLLTQAAEELRSNLVAITEAFPEHQHIVELTGGADSRLILCGLLSLGQAQQYRYFTRGSPQCADRVAAARLLDAYDLTAIATPEAYEDISLAQFVEGSRRCGGLRGLQATSFFMKTRYDDRVLYTGGHGETYLSPYCRTAVKKGTTSLALNAPIKQQHLLGVLKRTLLRRRVLWRSKEGALHERLSEVSTQLEGRDLGEQLQYLYNDFRNRFHFGLFAATRFAHSPCFQPLQSEAAIALSLKIPSATRFENAVTFNLMNKLFPAALLLPFANMRLPDSFLHDKLWADHVRIRELLGELEPPASRRPEPLATNKGPTPAHVRDAFGAVALKLCGLLSSSVQERLGIEQIYEAIDRADPAEAQLLSRHIVGQLGWAYWIELVNAATSQQVLLSFDTARPADALHAPSPS